MQNYSVDSKNSSVQFRIRYLSGYVTGQFREFRGHLQFDTHNPEKIKIEGEVSASSVDTRLGDRDIAIRGPDFLRADSFPKITFQSKSASARGSNSLRVVGDLTIRGQKREVEFDVDFHGQSTYKGAQRVAFTGKSKISRPAFEMLWNEQMSNGENALGTEIEITLEVQALPKSG